MCEASSIVPLAAAAQKPTGRPSKSSPLPHRQRVQLVAASERRVWSTRASAHAAVRSRTTRAMRAFPVFAARSCSAVSASCCSQTGCAFTTALTCGLVQSFAASVRRRFVHGGACIVERTHEPREASRTSHAPHAVVMWAGVRGRAARARPCDSASVGK